MVRAVSRTWQALRLPLAVLLGNAAGYSAFRLALVVSPALWRAGFGSGNLEGASGLRLLLTALTAILFAAPPVLIGALAARLGGRARPWVGLLAGLWGIGFVRWWPESVPLLGPEAWVGPTVLVLLSGLVGGWLMEMRATARAHRRAARSDAFGGPAEV